jgi:hypothetical protein
MLASVGSTTALRTKAADSCPLWVGTNLNGVFGITGDSWDDWWQPNPVPKSDPTVMEFIGRNSTNPGRPIYPRDTNTFGPVLGFAYNIPWLGQGQTVIRGGYSVTFQGGGNMAALDGTAGEIPGAIADANLAAASNSFVRLGDFGADHRSLTTPATFNFRDYPYTTVVPLPEDSITPGTALRPMHPVPLRVRPQGGIPTEFYDNTYVAPYVQNFNLTITRNLGRNMTLDVSYVATVARKLLTEEPINQPNFLTNGLTEAFDAARAGGESQLLDDLTSSVNGRTGVRAPSGCATRLFKSPTSIWRHLSPRAIAPSWPTTFRIRTASAPSAPPPGRRESKDWYCTTARVPVGRMSCRTTSSLPIRSSAT